MHGTGAKLCSSLVGHNYALFRVLSKKCIANVRTIEYNSHGRQNAMKGVLQHGQDCKSVCAY